MNARTYTSTRTEERRAVELAEGDRILDPEDRSPSILTIWRVERLGHDIWIDAMKRRSVTRKLAPHQMVRVCIPVQR